MGRLCYNNLFQLVQHENFRNLYYVSIIPDCYRSVPILMTDRPSVSIGTDFFSVIFITDRGWNAPILSVIGGVSDSYRFAPKAEWKHIWNDNLV